METMYTTKNVPAEIIIRRSPREKVLPHDNPLIQGWVWSNWVLAMTPGRHDNFKPRATTGYKITEAELKRQFINQTDPCGIYEWKARHTGTNKEYVVYIGSTCRSKGGNFIGRICEYCTNGIHKKDFINSALKNGYELWVRYKGSGGKTNACDRGRESAEWDENAVLKRYDYAWNIRSVKETRNLPYC